MATIGNTTSPAAGYDYIGSATAAASEFTMPTGGGVVTSISGYFDSESASQNGYLCVWDSSGNLLINSGAFAINNKSGSGAGGQDWWTKSISSVYVAAGTIWIGFVATGSLVFSSESSSTGLANTSYTKAMSSPGSFASPTISPVGAVGAYITYTPGGVGKVWPGSAWVDGTLIKIWNGSAWVQANPQTWSGSAWVVTT
ncbi:MAG: hypothetical protein KGH75_00680 [Rhodospirillales bacterium]|nr:hypothetical protein [Rhodospirillales bacterium]